MKFNVTVDLSDFYSEDDDYSFSEQIKKQISHEVKRSILKDWDQKINEEFNKAIVCELEKQKEAILSSKINSLISTAKIKKRYNSNEDITVTEWIIQELGRIHLKDSTLSNFLDSEIRKITKNISEELKNRYDMLFASQIVAKLHENGMLKEDVAKLLLNE